MPRTVPIKEKKLSIMRIFYAKRDYNKTYQKVHSQQKLAAYQKLLYE